MLETNKYSVVNIRRYLNSDNPKLGESRLLQALSGFSCPRNPDVERFLKKSSVALKPLTVKGEAVSNTVKRKLLRVSELDKNSDIYTTSAYLIAQIGKNFTGGAEEKITGEELLELAWNKIKEMQYLGGGMVTFLEAENEEKLLSFYCNNRLSQFDTRHTISDADEPHELVQLLRLL